MKRGGPPRPRPLRPPPEPEPPARRPLLRQVVHEDHAIEVQILAQELHRRRREARGPLRVQRRIDEVTGHHYRYPGLDRCPKQRQIPVHDRLHIVVYGALSVWESARAGPRGLGSVSPQRRCLTARSSLPPLRPYGQRGPGRLYKRGSRSRHRNPCPSRVPSLCSRPRA